jgi:hypothetical protein
LVCPQQKPLGDFQNSSPVGQKVILKLTTKPVICAVRPVACAQENPLRESILCATTSTLKSSYDKIHCTKSYPMHATTSTARQIHYILCVMTSYARQIHCATNPLRDKIHCVTPMRDNILCARQNPLRDKSTASLRNESALHNA